MEILSLQNICSPELCCNCAIIFATNIYKFIPTLKYVAFRTGVETGVVTELAGHS